jgi:hypothetical protein
MIIGVKADIRTGHLEYKPDVLLFELVFSVFAFKDLFFNIFLHLRIRTFINVLLKYY